MPSNLLINTQTTIGYNNKLKKATAEMKLGMNNTINSDTKLVGIKLMDGGKSKIRRLTKVSADAPGEAATAVAQNDDKETISESGNTEVNVTSVKRSFATPDTTNHEVTKVGVFIAVAVSASVIWKVIR